MTTPNRLFLASVFGCVLLSPAQAQFGNLLKGLVPKQEPDPAVQAAAAAAQAQAAAAQAQAAAAEAAAKAAREVFSKSVTPEQATAMGLAKLSPEEVAQVDAAVTIYAAQALAEFSAQMAVAMAGKNPALAGQTPAPPDESMAPGFLGIPGAPKFGLPGMDGTPVTADSLLESIASGGQFFVKANLKYSEAILPAERVKEINDMVTALNPKDGQAAVGAIEKMTTMLRERADIMLKEGKALSERSRGLIAEGNEEIGKGVLKWAVLTVVVAKTFKLGGNDEKMVAAITVAKNAVKDIVALKKLQGTMSKLSELKDAQPAATAAEAKP